MVPQIEDPNAEPEPEEMRGEFWVVFVCSLSAPKQVTLSVLKHSSLITMIMSLIFDCDWRSF